MQGAAASAAAVRRLGSASPESAFASPGRSSPNSLRAAAGASVDGHTLLASIVWHGEGWKVYEDLRGRDGDITFLSASGKARVLKKSAEAVFAEDGPQYQGLDLKDIGMSPHDLLAEKLLAHGDPDEDEVRRAAPPMDSTKPMRGSRPSWNTIVGTRECSDTMPVYPSGSTRTYHPVQSFKELSQEKAARRFEGLVGGWMPVVRKVFPNENGSYCEAIVFGDVVSRDRFIVQTWHRTALVSNGSVQKVVFGYSYPDYTRRRAAPSPDEFYAALLEFCAYWDSLIGDVVEIALRDPSWSDMTKHAFVKEQIVRPGGVYPKYGAVDRDYYGPEYDGFQDIFTMSLSANLECGRFTQAGEVFDNYFTEFVNSRGMVNMRGPETGQFGLTLSLAARYLNYTGEESLLLRHRGKIEAMANLLAELHDESLKLAETDRGFGLIHGWCESDSCLMPDPAIWWKPYFSNSACAVRGWRDLSRAWRRLNQPGMDAFATEWLRRSDQLLESLRRSVDANTRRDMTPHYLGPLPGTTMTFRESMMKERPSEQGWAHRCYAELLQPGVLTPEQENTIIDCMRAYGATTLGVVANVEPPHPNGRDILGFISYGYAEALLRLDRIEEYLLFLYAHRYHDHSRGSWTAGEVSGITGDGALFCIPAQQTIPLLVRWMLVYEDKDEDLLFLGRGVPRKWLGSGKTIAVEQAPTRWGRVNYRVERRQPNQYAAKVSLSGGGLPRALEVSFRLPDGKPLRRLTVNGREVEPAGRWKDRATFETRGERTFEVIAVEG